MGPRYSDMWEIVWQHMYPIYFTSPEEKITYSEEDSSKSLSGLVKMLENIFIKVEPSIISMFSSLFTILLTCSTMLVMLAEVKVCPSPVKFKIWLATSLASPEKKRAEKTTYKILLVSFGHFQESENITWYFPSQVRQQMRLLQGVTGILSESSQDNSISLHTSVFSKIQIVLFSNLGK